VFRVKVDIIGPSRVNLEGWLEGGK